MKLIDIINKVLGTNLNVTVANAAHETVQEPEESHYGRIII